MNGFWHVDIGELLILLPAAYIVVRLYVWSTDYVFHKHVEKTGVLHKDGIVYPRGMNGGER